MHKVSRAAGEQGYWQARQLLQDWLVRALANYNTNATGPGAPSQVDICLLMHYNFCAGLKMVYLLSS